MFISIDYLNALKFEKDDEKNYRTIILYYNYFIRFGKAMFVLKHACEKYNKVSLFSFKYNLLNFFFFQSPFFYSINVYKVDKLLNKYVYKYRLELNSGEFLGHISLVLHFFIIIINCKHLFHFTKLLQQP